MSGEQHAVDGERGTVALDCDDLDVDAVDVVWHRPVGGRSGRCGVIMTHGAGGTLDDPGLVALAGTIAAAGHVAVRCNMPYRQRRPKGPPPRAERGLGEFAVVVAAIAAAMPHVSDWVIGGKSYGGRLATMIAADVEGTNRIADASDIPAPVGVVCYSYPLHPPGTPDRVRVDHWGAVSVPVLFLQGTNDPFGGPDEVSQHLSLLAAPATVVSVAGGDHSLKVPRTRSADGATHAPAEVVAGLDMDTATWLATLADRA